MNIQFHNNFNKQFQKLRIKERERVKEKIKIFIRTPFDNALNNHPLKGKYKGYRSINISGNFRAIYKETSKQIIFVAVGSHSELYS